jgi:diguanylate cyclase (GGDEF)-like protein
MFRFVVATFLLPFFMCLPLFFVNVAYADVKNLYLENLSVEDGLSQGTILSTFQDDEGFVWIGTENGLNMYDGYNFRKLAGPDDDFYNHEFYKIIQDRKKLLWLNISEKGLFTYDKKKDEYQKILVTDPENKDYYIADMVEGENDDFWIASSKTIIAYNKASKKSIRVLDLSDELIANNTIQQILLHHNIIYIATQVGIFALNTETKTWKKLPAVSRTEINSNNFDAVSANKIWNLHMSSNNELYIGTSHGVYNLPIAYLNSYLAGDYTLPEYKVILDTGESWAFYADGDDLYFGEHTGLSVINTKTNSAKFLFAFNDYFDHINGNIVKSILKDKQGSFWLGSNATGIYKWDPKRSLVSNYRYKKGGKQSLSNNVVAAITGRRGIPEQLWIGTENGLNLLDLQKETITHYITTHNTKSGSRESDIYQVVEDLQQRLWLSTSKGTVLFDIATKKIIDIPYDEKVKNLLALEQYSVFYDHHNTVWSVTEKGFNRISLTTGEIDPLDEMNSAIEDGQISSILGYLPDSEKMLFATNDTLGYFDLDTRISTPIFKHPRIKKSEWTFVDSWAIDNKGILWFSFYGKGIIGLDSQTYEKKYEYSKSNSILDHSLYGVMTDSEGDIWVSSHNGLYMLDADSHHIRNFNVSDGLVAKEFNAYAFYQLPNNNLAYGAINGVSIIDPMTLKHKDDDAKLKVYATNIDVLSRDLALPFMLSDGDTVRLNYDDIGIRIDFSPLTYSKNKSVLFEYKLQGVDNINYPQTTENHITFPSLPSGQHTLKVNVKSPQTGLYSKPFTIHFDVSYAPLQSPLAYFIYLMVSLLLISFWFRKKRFQERLLRDAHEEVKFRENRLQLALTGSNSEVWDWQANNNLMFAKRAVDELGYPELRFSYSFEKHLSLIHHDEKELFLSVWKNFIVQSNLNESFVCSYRMLSSDGKWLWFKDIGKIVALDSKGNPNRITGAYTNITESLANAERAQFYGEAFKETKDWVLIISDNFTRVIANHAMQDIFSWPDEELPFNKDLFDLSEARFEFYADIFRSLEVGGHWRGEDLITTKDHQEYHVIVTIHAQKTDNANSLHFVCIFTDISAQKSAESELRYMANYDHLTGLPNRSLLLDRIKHAMASSSRISKSIALFFIDLDRFKQVNDSLGHDVGDLLLQVVTRRLTKALKVDDTVARIGGDEFVVLLESFKGNSQLSRIAQKIIDVIGEPVTLNEHVVSVGASIGIALYPEDAKGCDELLKNADVAMYHSKQLGRNTYQFFTSRMNAEVSARLAAESKLKLAHDNQEFINHYQPIVDSYQGKAIGAELLLRWQSGDQLIPPNDFIPTAEELGLIIPMTEDAIRRGAEDLIQWRTVRPNIYLSINLSTLHFLKDSLVPFLKQIITEFSLPADALKFEVTESMLISDPEKAISTMKAIDNLGFSFALDDFGTGFSSLSYLKNLPLKVLKIDRSFISGIGIHTADEAIVEATLALANSLKLKCIAEGVETEEQLKFLAEKDCHLIQGYFYSKPIEAVGIAQYLLINANEITADRPE